LWVGLRNIVVGWFEEYSVVDCWGLLWVCCVVGCVVNVDKDRRGGWMEGDGKGLGCIRINLILPI